MGVRMLAGLERDEAQRFPEALSGAAVRDGHAEVREMAAPRRGLPGLRRRVRACLDQADELPGRVAQAELIETILAKVREFQLEAARLERRDMPRDVLVHVRERRSPGRRLMQAERDAAIGHDRVWMRPGLASRCRDESQLLVERDGAAHVFGGQADLVETA